MIKFDQQILYQHHNTNGMERTPFSVLSQKLAIVNWTKHQHYH